MTKTNNEKLKLVKSQVETEEDSGIFLAEYKMSNMKMHRIVVSDAAIFGILEGPYKLTEEAQEEAVNNLVDRTPEWVELGQDVQVEKIKAVLTQEMVLEYLVETGSIKKDCDIVNVGIDKEGSIVIEAYYTTVNREQRRLADKAVSESEKQKMREAINIFGSDDSIVEQAKKKLEQIEKNKEKVVPFKKKK